MKLLFIILILIFIAVFVVFKLSYGSNDLVYEKATFDNNYYLVRNVNDKSIAADKLALIKQNMIKLITYLKDNLKKFPKNTQYVKDLVSRTKVIHIMESSSDEKYTSYTINKGEKIVLCLRSKTLNTIHDMNTIMYVVIHEMAHIGCPEYGHTPLFKEIFKFLLTQASIIKIYTPIDYRLNPQDYCGMTINEYLLDT